VIIKISIDIYCVEWYFDPFCYISQEQGYKGQKEQILQRRAVGKPWPNGS